MATRLMEQYAAEFATRIKHFTNTNFFKPLIVKQLGNMLEVMQRTIQVKSWLNTLAKPLPQ